jgi:hypothetical protein
MRSIVGSVDPFYSRALFLGLFTVEHHIILHSVGKVTAAKFDEVFKRMRGLFVD